MSLHSYTPLTSVADAGRALWVDVAAGRLLAVFADPRSTIADELAGVDLAGEVPDILERVSSVGDGSGPSFALCYPVAGETDASETALGVIVHGDAVVQVEGTNGRRTVRTRGFIRWAEDHIDGARRYRIGTGASEDDDAEAIGAAGDGAARAGMGRLRLADGQVWASDVVGTIGDGGAGSEDTDSAVMGSAGTDSQGTNARSGDVGSRDVESTGADGPDAESTDAESPAAQQEDVPSESTLIPGAEGFPVPEAEPGGEDDTGSADTDSVATDSLDTDSEDRGNPETDASGGSDDGAFGPAEPDEQTMVRPPGGVVPAPGADAGGANASDELGDHDGQTVLAGDVRAAREAARAASASDSDDLPPTEGMPVISYVIDLPGGAVQPLDAPVVVGRAPSVSSVPASGLPHLVTVSGDDISRNHVRVAVQGDAVVVADLHSSNGTQVVLPGRAPQRLRPGEPMTVIEGTTIDLGSGVSLRIREA